MKKPEKQQEIKASLLEDMLSCITYTPNRESDILAFIVFGKIGMQKKVSKSA